MQNKLDTSHRDVLFFEKQRFTQWWIWAIILLINGIFIFGFFYQIILGNPLGDNPMSDTWLIISLIISLIFSGFFLSMNLQTIIKKDGIYVKFFPFHLSYKKYKWEEIKQASVRKYSPLSEFGGWGVRGVSDNKALSVSGKLGLQLEFENGKKLLIGTQKEEELIKALTILNKL
jgi:hypothetical protein